MSRNGKDDLAAALRKLARDWQREAKIAAKGARNGETVASRLAFLAIAKWKRSGVKRLAEILERHG